MAATGHEIDLQAAEFLQVHRPSRTGHNGEHAQRHPLRHEAGDQRHGPVQQGEGRQETLFLPHPNEGQAHGQAKHHHRRHQIIGKRVERIGRNEEGEEVDLLGWCDERGTEEAGRFPGGEGEGHDENGGTGHPPGAHEHGTDFQGQRFHLRIGEAPEASDERQGEIREHRHLQQEHKGLPHVVQKGYVLAKYHPYPYPQHQSEQHLGGETETHGALWGHDRASFLGFLVLSRPSAAAQTAWQSAVRCPYIGPCPAVVYRHGPAPAVLCSG